MLGNKKMIELAQTECIKMLGEEFVKKHKDRCCPCYGINDDKLFRFTLALSVEDKPYKMGDETPMDYYATVTVSPKSGEVTRIYKDSNLPDKST